MLTFSARAIFSRISKEGAYLPCSMKPIYVVLTPIFSANASCVKSGLVLFRIRWIFLPRLLGSFAFFLMELLSKLHFEYVTKLSYGFSLENILIFILELSILAIV